MLERKPSSTSCKHQIPNSEIDAIERSLGITLPGLYRKRLHEIVFWRSWRAWQDLPSEQSLPSVRGVFRHTGTAHAKCMKYVTEATDEQCRCVAGSMVERLGEYFYLDRLLQDMDGLGRDEMREIRHGCGLVDR